MMGRWGGVALLALIGTCGGAAGLPREADDRETDTWETLTNGTEARALLSRRLGLLDAISGAASSLTEGALSGFSGGAKDFVKNAMTTASTMLPGNLQQVLQIFKDSQQWITQGLEFANKAWVQFGSFAGWLQGIFKLFQQPIASRRLQADEAEGIGRGLTGAKSLQDIFSAGDVVSLITSMPLLHQLIVLVQHVLESSKFMKTLVAAVRKVTEIFGELSTVFKQALGKLSSRRLTPEESRRLDGLSVFTDLLKGIDFDTMTSTLATFLSQVSSQALTLDQVKSTLGPLLAKLEAKTARRLSIEADQKMYSDAISKVVPTWQKVESTGIALCPNVMDSQSLVSSLKCRVSGFIDGNGILANLGGLVGSNGLCEVKTAARRLSDYPVAAGVLEVTWDAGVLDSSKSRLLTAASQCPTQSQSAGVSDLLSENAGSLGFILAAMAALGCLGAGGAGAAAAFAGGKSEDSEAEGEELLEGGEE